MTLISIQLVPILDRTGIVLNSRSGKTAICNSSFSGKNNRCFSCSPCSFVDGKSNIASESDTGMESNLKAESLQGSASDKSEVSNTNVESDNNDNPDLKPESVNEEESARDTGLTSSRSDTPEDAGSMSSHDSDDSRLKITNQYVRRENNANSQLFSHLQQEEKRVTDSINYYHRQYINPINDSLTSNPRVSRKGAKRAEDLREKEDNRTPINELKNNPYSVEDHKESHEMDKKYGESTLILADKNKWRLATRDRDDLVEAKSKLGHYYKEREDILDSIQKTAEDREIINQKVLGIKLTRKQNQDKKLEENSSGIINTEEGQSKKRTIEITEDPEASVIEGTIVSGRKIQWSVEGRMPSWLTGSWGSTGVRSECLLNRISIASLENA